MRPFKGGVCELLHVGNLRVRLSFRTGLIRSTGAPTHANHCRGLNLFFRVKPENKRLRVISSKRIYVGEISEDT